MGVEAITPPHADLLQEPEVTGGARTLNHVSSPEAPLLWNVESMARPGTEERQDVCGSSRMGYFVLFVLYRTYYYVY